MDKPYHLQRFSGLKFSHVKNVEVQDSQGHRIGRLLDAIFKQTDDGLQLSKFTIGGSRFEELLEDIGLKKDIDPVFSVDLIKAIGPKRIKLNVEQNALKSTEVHDDAIQSDEIKLSWLSKMKLFDNTNEHIGNIQDLKFYENGFKFIVGDGMFKELLEDLGWIADVDFLITPSYIQSIEKNKITLSKSRNEMKATFDRHIDKSREQAEQVKESVNVFFPITQKY
ncbi:MAG: hypothetical protein ACXAB7_15485 [Candidatus Kariarchaeaceae archaeon]|jgi:sporulation protein YlmC with PRC-barrel domain